MGIFVKNVLSTFITLVLGFALGLVITVIITRGLGPEEKGVYAMAMLLTSLLITFTNFGLNPATTYFTGSKKYLAKEIFGNNILFTFFLSVFAIIIGLIVIFLFSDKLFPGVKTEYLFLALSIIPISYFFDFTSQILLGLQKIIKLNIVSLLNSLFFVILLAISILWFHHGIRAAIISQFVSYCLVTLIVFFLVKKEAGGISFKINKQYLKNAFFYGVKVYWANIFYFFHQRVNIFMVNFFINPLNVGFYVTALGLSEGTQRLSNAVASVLFPRIASGSEDEIKEFTPRVCRNVLFITLLLVIFLFIFAKILITLLYSKQFLNSVLPFQILIVGSIAFSGWMVLHTDLYGRGKPGLNTYIIGISSLLNAILNIIWIPMFGIIGASLALAISYTVMFLITLFIYIRISHNKIENVIFIKKSDFIYYLFFINNLRNKAKVFFKK